MSFIEVRHNIEVAHRLSLLPGKCENIHGHSMWVTIRLEGVIGATGILKNQQGDVFDFGSVKKEFRDHLDNMYDHQLLLNKADPWAAKLYDQETEGMKGAEGHLPGLVVFDGDPTTENLAKWIAEWAALQFRANTQVQVQETHVNAAQAGASWLHQSNTVGWVP
jgi:6-pyruvoyltetrahydropterin/6-carboxytetrahydropterin synthase